jgi:hypothetical protein
LLKEFLLYSLQEKFFGILLHGPPRSRYSGAEYLLLWSSWYSAPHGPLRRHGILLEDTVTVTAGWLVWSDVILQQDTVTAGWPVWSRIPASIEEFNKAK